MVKTSKGGNFMYNSHETDLVALAAEEAIRLYEVYFHHHHPYTVEIETDGVPSDRIDYFCRLVEEELELKGEKIRRDGRYFKIAKYQAH